MPGARGLWPQGGLWRHGDFLKLWSAQTISQFGSAVSQVAIPLVAVLTLHASAFEVAVLSTIEFLPFLLFTLPAGVWVDRLPDSLKLLKITLGVGCGAVIASALSYSPVASSMWEMTVRALNFLFSVLSLGYFR